MNTIKTVYSADLGWRCDVISDGTRHYLKFYNSSPSGDNKGPWMSLPVSGIDGQWTIGDLAHFEEKVTNFLASVSVALTEAGIDHLG